MTDAPISETVEPVPEPTPVMVLQAAVQSVFGVTLINSVIEKGELSVRVAVKDLPHVLTQSRDQAEFAFQQLIDLCGVDYPSRPARFEVVYHLLSLRHNHRIRIKASVQDGESVPSVMAIYPTSAWFEREAWDMYGIPFDDNPDLRRLLTDYGFEGHPLRKDFPLTGFVEVRYDEAQKRVVYEQVKLNQDFRQFDFVSPWEGLTNVQLPGDEKAVRPNFWSQE